MCPRFRPPSLIAKLFSVNKKVESGVEFDGGDRGLAFDSIIFFIGLEGWGLWCLDSMFFWLLVWVCGGMERRCCNVAFTLRAIVEGSGDERFGREGFGRMC